MQQNFYGIHDWIFQVLSPKAWMQPDAYLHHSIPSWEAILISNNFTLTNLQDMVSVTVNKYKGKTPTNIQTYNHIVTQIKALWTTVLSDIHVVKYLSIFLKSQLISEKFINHQVATRNTACRVRMHRKETEIINVKQNLLSESHMVRTQHWKETHLINTR